MDINLLTIGISSLMPAQSVQPNPARGAGKAEGCNEPGRDGSQTSQTERSAAKKCSEQSSEGVIHRDDIQSSDNVACGTRISEKEPHNGDFENVLRRQLRPNESNRAKITEKPQKIDISAQNGELLPPISLQNGISHLIEQKKPTEDLKQVPKQTKPIIRQAISQSTESSLKATRSATVENQGKEVLQQTAVASNQTKPMQKVLSATAEGASVQQGEQQSQITGTREVPADGKRTAGNTSTIKPRSVDESGVCKPVESASQHKSGVNNETVGSKTPNMQPGTYIDKNIVSQSQELVSAVGRPDIAESANTRVKDKVGNDKRAVSRQEPADTQQASGLAEKLEKVEISSGIINTPKSESGNNPAQNSPSQIAGFGSVTANPPVIDAGSAKASVNVTNEDAAASVREQIYQSVKSSIQQGTSEITIRLNPPELGQVSVKFSEQGNELTGVLEATNPQTRAEIRQAIPEIIRSLEESGVSIKRIDVTLSSDSPRQSAQQSLRDNTSQNLWEQLGQRSFQDNTGNRSSYESYITPAYSGDAPDVHGVASTSFGRNQASPSDNLLDVLI